MLQLYQQLKKKKPLLSWVTVLALTLIFGSAFAECREVQGQRGMHNLVEVLQVRQGVYGADVSFYQGVVDWKRARATGVRFAFAKATEGVSHVDPCFHSNWSNMKEAGIIRGAYHFFHGHRSGADQARYFISTVKHIHNPATDLPPVVDVEYTSGVVATPRELYIERLRQWLQVVQNEFGVKPMIYTNRNFWHSYMKGVTIFNDYPLWLASYSNAPKLPHPWREYDFWQFSQSGSIPGVTTAVDMNLFGQGDSIDDLMKFLQQESSSE